MASTTTVPNPETRGLKPENQPLNDVGIRLVMIPAFGVVIPHVTGYFGPYGPGSAMYWIGLAWANLISFALWHGNRFFLLKQREHYDWFQQPTRKIVVLLFATVFYTAPCAVLLMLAWYRMAGFGPEWDVIRTVTLASVICVAFITHVYETVYLIRQRESDAVAVERLERARTAAELEALKAQVAPHFLFNSLNTLAWLIENDRERALEFNQNLAEVYRYILLARKRELTPLAEELRFLRQYWALLELRFGPGVRLELDEAHERGGKWFLPPMSLQVLVENAVKHNEHTTLHPLAVRVAFEEEAVTVANEKRPVAAAVAGSKSGLSGLDDRCRLTLGRGLRIEDGAAEFKVTLPVRMAP